MLGSVEPGTSAIVAAAITASLALLVQMLLRLAEYRAQLARQIAEIAQQGYFALSGQFDAIASLYAVLYGLKSSLQQRGSADPEGITQQLQALISDLNTGDTSEAVRKFEALRGAFTAVDLANLAKFEEGGTTAEAAISRTNREIMLMVAQCRMLGLRPLEQETLFLSYRVVEVAAELNWRTDYVEPPDYSLHLSTDLDGYFNQVALFARRVRRWGVLIATILWIRERQSFTANYTARLHARDKVPVRDDPDVVELWSKRPKMQGSRPPRNDGQ